MKPVSSDFVSPTPPRRSWYSWRNLGLNFLTISVLLHLIFGFGATYFIVQTIQAKRKQTFAGAPSSPNAPTHVIEHKVQLQKKQQTMSAPAPIRRITTTSNSKVALPAMPAMPKMDSAITPVAMAGMGGTGVSMGMGASGGGGSGGGGVSGLSLFGFRDNRGGGTLTGTFYDLKQTSSRQPTSIGKSMADGAPTPEASKEYQTVVSSYITGGINDDALASRYFKGPNPLYTTQIFIPRMNAVEGPKAFGLNGQVQPSRWLVHYKGAVIPPESGSYHFVGVCDDVLVVRFNGNIVLDCGSMFPSGRKPTEFYAFDGLEPMLASHGWFRGCGEGSAFNVEAGQTYPIDIVIGEWPGGEFKAYLQLRKDGVEYKKDSHGNPILPLFRLAAGKLAQTPGKGTVPVYDENGPLWKGAKLP